MRRSNPLPAVFAGFVLTVFAATPNPAAAAPFADRAPVELVRAGDSTMTCQALATEINQLAAVDQAAAQPAPKKKKFGFLKTLGHVAPFLGPVGMLGSGVGMALASSAVGAASSLGQSSQSSDMADQSRQAMTRAMAGPSVESQRRDRLSQMFEDKHC